MTTPELETRKHAPRTIAKAALWLFLVATLPRKREGHGHGLHRVDLSQVDVAATTDDDALLLVNEALDKLAVEAPDKVQLALVRSEHMLACPENTADLRPFLRPDARDGLHADAASRCGGFHSGQCLTEHSPLCSRRGGTPETTPAGNPAILTRQKAAGTTRSAIKVRRIESATF
jgi:hypothetical protein